MVLCGEGDEASTLKQVQVGKQDFKIKQVPDIEIQHLTHPFFIDVDLDDNIDILFNDKDGNLMVAVNSGDKFKVPVSFWDNYVSKKDYCYQPAHPDSITLTANHFSAVGDFDGDCIPDLFLTTQMEESYALLLTIIEDKEIMYCMTDPSKSTSLGDMTGHVVADFDMDAMLDIAAFDDSRDEVVIYYNRLSAKQGSDLCYDMLDQSDSGTI